MGKKKAKKAPLWYELKLRSSRRLWSRYKKKFPPELGTEVSLDAFPFIVTVGQTLLALASDNLSKGEDVVGKALSLYGDVVALVGDVESYLRAVSVAKAYWGQLASKAESMLAKAYNEAFLRLQDPDEASKEAHERVASAVSVSEEEFFSYLHSLYYDSEEKELFSKVKEELGEAALEGLYRYLEDVPEEGWIDEGEKWVEDLKNLLHRAGLPKEEWEKVLERALEKLEENPLYGDLQGALVAVLKEDGRL